MSDVIFLRPYAFLLLLPVAILLYLSASQKTKTQSYIAPHLLVFLTKHKPAKTRISMPWIIFIFCCLMVAALAGPAVPQRTPLVKSNAYSIVLLGMDKTMYADDLKPSRLSVTKEKLNAFLSRNSNVNTALIAFAGTAHIISPFTDDHSTLMHFIDALNPSVMPEAGSNIVDAVKLAAGMLSPLKSDTPVKIVIITDQLTVLQSEKIVSYMKPLGWTADIVYVGTTTGSVVPLPEGGLLKTYSGQLIVAKTPINTLTDTAAKLGGKSYNLNELSQISLNNHSENSVNKSAEIIIYRELSYYLLLPIILMACCFRRGYILGCLFIFSVPSYTYAQNLALDLYKQGKYQQAADNFQDNTWKGNALYRAGNFTKAIQYYEKVNTPVAHYNRGNALAHSGKIKEAIIAYNQAIQLNPQFQEAKDNKNILEEWLKKQAPENQEDPVVAELQKQNSDIEKALEFLKALPEDPGSLMQKRLQLQLKNKAN